MDKQTIKLEIQLGEADKKKFLEPYMLVIWLEEKGCYSSMSSSYKTEAERLEAIKEYIKEHTKDASSTKGVTIERVGNITKHGTEAIRVVAGTDKEYESYVDKYSTKNEVNSQENKTIVGDMSNATLTAKGVPEIDKTPDTHSQIKKEINKDYAKTNESEGESK